MSASLLTHEMLFRPGTSSNGCTTAERCSSDFMVDGESLLHTLVKVDGGHSDFMGCFVKGFPEQNEKALAKLMVKAEPDTERGGVLLYICPECGDIGCGAYSALVKKTDVGYVWDSFAYENGYEEPRLVDGIGPFLFVREPYETALSRAAAL